MSRRCKHSQCRSELPPASKCTDYTQKKGFCSFDHMVLFGSEQGKKSMERKRKQKKAQAKRDVRELNRRDLKWQHKQSKTVFNRMRVLEESLWFQQQGLNPTCISCGRENMDWCCGHYKTVGAQSNLRYDRNNTFLQCNRYCNKGLSGNIEGDKNTRGYKQGLVDRFGQDEAQRIMDYCDSHTEPYKWNWEELEQWRKEWSARIRELEQKVI